MESDLKGKVRKADPQKNEQKQNIAACVPF